MGLFSSRKRREEAEKAEKDLKTTQKNCSHPSFIKIGRPTYDCAYGADQEFKCTCCGYIVSKWPEWDGTL